MNSNTSPTVDHSSQITDDAASTGSLPQSAKVVVIGGGVVGCSILYHLAKMGWQDVVLLERSELTSGSSWHAAGQIHTISSDPNISRLQGYTINLYKELEEISGQSVGMHSTGGFYLASTEDWYDYLKRERSKARYMGLDQEFISPEEVAKLNPLIDPSKYIAALYDPLDGHIDPSGVTYAYAKAAKHYGAKWFRNAPVTATVQRNDGSWDVTTPLGKINAEMIVNAGGLWAREVGLLAGIDLPVQPMEHHYLITESISEIAEHVQQQGKEICAGIDYEANIYFRQEHQGLLLGTYEAKATPWKVAGTPMDFGHELLENDLDRVADRLEMAFDRMPALGRAGIKSIVNGPFTFGPDGNPMIGPVPGLRNYWTAVGVMAGFCQAGGVGLCLAEWMIEGEPSIDVWAMDIARFGEFATRDYGTVKSTENYERRFKLTFPNEELPAMRQQKTTAIYDDLIQKGAVMGASFGLEHALWFAESPETAHENPSFRRSNAFDYVANEVKAVRENVGMIEIANFSKHEITGSGAKAFLDYLTPIILPKPGRIKLTPLLTPKGKLYGDLSVANLGNDRYMLFGSGNAQEMHRRWIEKHLPAQGVHYANRTDDYHGLAISGPKSRALLQTLTRDNLDKANFKFSEIREASLAGVPVILVRLSFSGELGYEIYCKPVYLRKLYQAITKAGEKYSLQHYGARALMSLRLEKGWGVWGSDYRPDFTAAESGLSAFINYQKESFIGKKAVVQEQKSGARKQLITLVVNTDDIDCHNDEAVFHNGECVGYVSSGGYAHWVQKSVVMAYVPSTLVNDQASFEVEILGKRYPAILYKAPLYDPQGLKMLS